MYTTIAGLLTLLSIFVWYLKKRNEYWKDRNVPYEKAKLLVGNMWDAFCGRKNAAEVADDIYKNFPGAKYCGFFYFGMPALMIRDPELLERIFIKDFSKFRDNGLIIDEKRDPVLAKNPFFAKGNHWKAIRNQLSPQFSPLKMKNMFPLMDEVKDRLVTYLNEEPNARGKEGLDAKVLAMRYTTEMVASCAFGLYGNCFNDDKAEIMTLSQNIFQINGINMLIWVLASMFPIIYRIRAPQALAPDSVERFKNIILSTLKEREEKNVRRGDFLDAIVEMKEKTTAFEYTSEYITAHAMSFYIDGTETISTVLQFAMYELAKNPNIQEKLRKECETVLEENDGKLTYDKLLDIEYLEWVIHETLRLYPAILSLQKECTETATFPPARDGDPELIIEKGTNVFIPVMSLHRDPQHFPDAEQFMPERFSPEANNSRAKITYLGFGDGPRICLGRRFALAVIKVALFGVLTNFRMEVNEKTPKVLELDPVHFSFMVKGGVWLNFYPIHRSL